MEKLNRPSIEKKFILDEFDRKILYELDKDASSTHKYIAKQINRSKEFVHFRIKRLEQEQIVLGYSAIVDMSKLGYFTFRIYIKWQEMTKAQKQEFYKYITQIDNVWTTTVLHGKWDFAFFIGVKETNAFHQIWDDILATYKEKVAKSKIAIYAPVYNFNKTFFLKEQKKKSHMKRYSTQKIQRIYGDSKQQKHDLIDEKIIKLYAADINIPKKDIAKKLKISAESIRKRIINLKKKDIIVGHKININLQKIGFQGYRVDFRLKHTKDNAKIFEYIKNHKYFYQINKSIGGADFECEIVVESLQHLLDILEETIQTFNGSIQSYEYFGYSEFPSLAIIPD